MIADGAPIAAVTTAALAGRSIDAISWRSMSMIPALALNAVRRCQRRMAMRSRT